MKYQQENIFMTGVTGKVLQFFLTTSFAKGTQSQTCGGLPLVPSSQTRNIHYKPTDIYKYVITVSLAFYNSGLFKKKTRQIYSILKQPQFNVYRPPIVKIILM
jgi:hypothetical protein